MINLKEKKMFGDLILCVQNWFRKLFCIHEYRYIETFTGGFFRCRKCHRIKI